MWAHGRAPIAHWDLVRIGIWDVTSPKEGEMLAKQLLEILVCPQCKGDLEYDQVNEKLTCHACKLRYEIRDDIPVMLLDEAQKYE